MSFPVHMKDLSKAPVVGGRGERGEEAGREGSGPGEAELGKHHFLKAKSSPWR